MKATWKCRRVIDKNWLSFWTRTHKWLYLIHLISRNKNLRQFSPHSLVWGGGRTQTLSLPKLRKHLDREPQLAPRIHTDVLGRRLVPPIFVSLIHCAPSAVRVCTEGWSVWLCESSSGRTRSQLWQVTVHLLLTMPCTVNSSEVLRNKNEKIQLWGLWDSRMVRRVCIFSTWWRGHTTLSRQHYWDPVSPLAPRT